jgi:Transposase IS116/IS110/IS902 family
MGASSVAVIAAVVTQIAALARQLEAGFESHPNAEVVRSLPGPGTVPGARVLRKFGDEPNRYGSPKSRKNYAGTSPINRASGTKRVVLAPLRPQPAPRRCHLHVGVRRAHRLTRSPLLLRHPTGRRRHPPRRPPSPRQPPRRHPPRPASTTTALTTKPSHGHTGPNKNQPSRLTDRAEGCLAMRRPRSRARHRRSPVRPHGSYPPPDPGDGYNLRLLRSLGDLAQLAIPPDEPGPLDR